MFLAIGTPIAPAQGNKRPSEEEGVGVGGGRGVGREGGVGAGREGGGGE